MAKDKITEYDSVANSNTVCGDVNIAENSALPSDMNNFAREIMSHLKEGLGSGTPLYVDQTNNRVGINKTPTVALDVSGSLSVDGGTIKLDGNYPTGSNNVALGNTALDSISTGASNTAIGADALTSNTTASNNVAVGYQAGNAITTGQQNTAIGSSSLDANTTGTRNTSIGYNAMGANTTATANVAIGDHALQSKTTTGNDNVAIGTYAASGLTTGANGTFVGSGAGQFITTGTKNTIIGRFTGNQGGLDIRTSSNNIVISDGDGNPRCWFDNEGDLHTGNQISSPNVASTGHLFFVGGAFYHTRSGGEVGFINRLTNDGGIINFYQDTTLEGTISVSGTTVSYNGGHLSRWSQLTDNSRDNTIVKGTVMTNLDQMAEWTTDGVTEDNEQLNCMAVSSVEGDANVAGVFVNWDNDDDIYTNDMNVAMTGDMVIRIAQGTTVARGDLLMSAGDGTAKPQGDDIVRSKTIAKVTSTNVSHTYDDGTYLVPCVLMAC